MRKILLLGCIVVSSCASWKTALCPFVTIYERASEHNILPAYIILREQPELYEIYSPQIFESIFGQWKISNDTLYLFPIYEAFERDGVLKFSTKLDTSILTIPQKYLMRCDSIIDITDYSGLFPEAISIDIDNCHEVYKRVDYGIKR